MENNAIDVNDLRGVYPALITPMHGDGSIDYEKLHSIIDDQIEAGIAGLAVCATTGQGATMGEEEHVSLARHIFNYVDGDVPIIVSTGSNDTEAAVRLSTLVESLIGPTTFLQVVPYYNKPTQEGMIAHFEYIARKIHRGSNIILYNVPSRTGVNLEAKTTIALSKNSKIIGIKEASHKVDQVIEIIRNTDSDSFHVLSGEDDQVVPIILEGGYGTISASANAAPRYFQKMVDIALEGGHETAAQQMQDKIDPLVRLVFHVSNPIPLAHMFGTDVRLPLQRLIGPKEEVFEGILKSTMEKYTAEELGIDIMKYR